MRKEDVIFWEGARFQVDLRSFMSQHDIVYQRPTNDRIEGLLLGNGDLGLTVYGSPERLLINVGKNDVWDRRIEKQTRKPYTQAEFYKIVTHLGEGKPTTEDEKAIFFFHEEAELRKPYSRVYPCPKPCGEIIISNAQLTHHDKFAQRLSLYDAVLESLFEQANSQERLLTFTHATENLIVVNYAHRGESLDLVIQLRRWNDRADETMTQPTVGCDEKYLWVKYRFPPDSLYPEGFEYVMLATIDGTDYRTKGHPNVAEARIKGDKQREFTLYVSVISSRDAENPFKEAKRLLEEAMLKGHLKIREEHKAWWHDFWQKPFIDLSDDFIENLWYVQQYLLACCSKAGKVAPGLFGNWIATDSSPWHGDYHLDYNFQQTFWGVYSSNHIELAYPYYEAILDILPMARREARDIYNCRGAKYPIVSFPIRLEENPYPVFPWDRCMCLTAWVMQGFWWHYKYTLDKNFLREKAYPLMRECALFYEDFLKKDETGRYYVFPTVSPEHHGVTLNFRLNRNCTIDIALIKFLMRATIEASRILNVDEDERRKWKDIAENISDYPTFESKAGRILVDIEDAEPLEYNLPVSVTPVFPGEDIGVDSSQALYEVAKRTAENIRVNTNNSYIILAMARARLGLRDAYQSFRDETTARLICNGTLNISLRAPWSKDWRDLGVWIENFSYTAVVNELLIQSYDGKIRISPALPENLRVRVHNLRVVGAFLVSAEIEAGEAKYITVKSLKGSKCTVVNPWMQNDVRLRDITEDKELINLSTTPKELIFNTKSEHVYIIDRRSKPFESYPITLLRGDKREKPRKEELGRSKEC